MEVCVSVNALFVIFVDNRINHCHGVEKIQVVVSWNLEGMSLRHILVNGNVS